jgi:membrane protease YdiL (CAAX protease family)
LNSPVDPSLSQRQPAREPFIWLALAFEGGLFLLAAAIAWWFKLPLPEQVHWVPGDALWALVATLPPLAVLWWSRHTRFPPLRRLRQSVDELVVPLFAPCTLIDFLLLSLVAGLGEEALFRGVIQSPLSHYLPAWAAIAVAGVLFGLVHWINFTYAVFATIIGVYLGWLFSTFDNLLPPIIVHTLYDFAALAYLTRTTTTPTASGGRQPADDRRSEQPH